MSRISTRLSERQEQVIDYVCEVASEGRLPSAADIAREFEFSRQCAAVHVRALIRKGWLLRRSRLELTPTEKAWRRQVVRRQEKQARSSLPRGVLSGGLPSAVVRVQAALDGLDVTTQQLVFAWATR